MFATAGELPAYSPVGGASWTGAGPSGSLALRENMAWDAWNVLGNE